MFRVYRALKNTIMIWFFLGFVFGVFIAQESPQFPNIKDNSIRFYNFTMELLNQQKEKQTTRTRSKSE
jgi:hypothetical protein